MTLFVGASTFGFMNAADRTILDRVERSLPSPLGGRLASLRRDLAMVLDGLAGRTPPPVVWRREGAPSPAAPRSATGRSVVVRAVVRETDDAVSLVLTDPAGQPFTHAPGQFYTLCATVDGRPLRRAYSASDDGGDRHTLRLTVKRVAGGAMSNWLHRAVTEGAHFEVLGPSGTFTPDRAAKHHVLVGGGSGITPLYAIACAVLRDDASARVTLVFANRAKADTIFDGALTALTQRYGDRFARHDVLETAHEGFAGTVGRLDGDTARRVFDGLDLDEGAVWYVCGPTPMREAVRAVLRERGVADGRVREEVFTSPATVTPNTEAQTVTLRLRGRSRRFEVRGGESILDAAMREGVDAPFSCTVGGCGACRCRVVEGSVEMAEPNGLRPDERAAGLVLTCVGRPVGDVVLEVP